MDEIIRKIAELRHLETLELRAKWREIHRADPPPGISRDLLIRAAAHQIQKAAFGDLDKRTKNQLRRISRSGPFNEGKPQPQNTLLKPGTQLIREWHGRTYSVTKQNEGFEFKGRIYRSLSQIACKITGARWSGPRFFGISHGERS